MRDSLLCTDGDWQLHDEGYPNLPEIRSGITRIAVLETAPGHKSNAALILAAKQLYERLEYTTALLVFFEANGGFPSAEAVRNTITRNHNILAKVRGEVRS